MELEGTVRSMETKALRSETTQWLLALGVELPGSLPLLDDTITLRRQPNIVDRLLTLHAVAAVAHGLDRRRGLQWLEGEGLQRELSPSEEAFLTQGEGRPDSFRTQVEAIWALAWVLALEDDFGLTKPCSPNLAAKLPNLKFNESGARLREFARLRPVQEVAQLADLAFGLHWAVVNARLIGKPLPFTARLHTIAPRRKALDWCISSDPWDEVSLDT